MVTIEKDQAQQTITHQTPKILEYSNIYSMNKAAASRLQKTNFPNDSAE